MCFSLCLFQAFVYLFDRQVVAFAIKKNARVGIAGGGQQVQGPFEICSDPVRIVGIRADDDRNIAVSHFSEHGTARIHLG